MTGFFIGIVLSALLHVEVWPVARTENRVIVYWVVEFSGLDCDGNIHRIREEVNTYGDATELGVATIAKEQLLKRPELGSFLEAICEAPEVELTK